MSDEKKNNKLKGLCNEKENIRYFTRIILNCFAKSDNTLLKRINISEVILLNDVEGRYSLYGNDFQLFDDGLMKELQEVLKPYETTITETKKLQNGKQVSKTFKMYKLEVNIFETTLLFQI